MVAPLAVSTCWHVPAPAHRAPCCPWLAHAALHPGGRSACRLLGINGTCNADGYPSSAKVQSTIPLTMRSFAVAAVTRDVGPAIQGLRVRFSGLGRIIDVPISGAGTYSIPTGWVVSPTCTDCKVEVLGATSDTTAHVAIKGLSEVAYTAPPPPPPR